jgi:hypothetical protein
MFTLVGFDWLRLDSDLVDARDCDREGDHSIKWGLSESYNDIVRILIVSRLFKRNQHVRAVIVCLSNGGFHVGFALSATANLMDIMGVCPERINRTDGHNLDSPRIKKITSIYEARSRIFFILKKPRPLLYLSGKHQDHFYNIFKKWMLHLGLNDIRQCEVRHNNIPPIPELRTQKKFEIGVDMIVLAHWWYGRESSYFLTPKVNNAYLLALLWNCLHKISVSDLSLRSIESGGSLASVVV